MNFKLSFNERFFLGTITGCIGLMQVLTPLYLRTLVDGILPSKDGAAIAWVLIIIGVNEILLVLANSTLNRRLDELEQQYTQSFRTWMLKEVTKLTSALAQPEGFYQSWTQDAKRLVYKKIKNPWFRSKDFVVLFLLSLICLNISFLAGLLIILIAALSLALVKFHQEDQATDTRQLHQLMPQEKNLFDQFIRADLAGKEKLSFELSLLSAQVNETQHRITQQRTGFQDINNLIRFVMMFSILGVGGYLFASEKLSMGSLWAMLITMYRITPPLQSLVRWILQARADENLEARILENMHSKETFKKPAYYNRLVKLIEKSLKTPARKMIVLDEAIDPEEIRHCLLLWLSFYSAKDKVEVCPEDQFGTDEEKLYLLVGKPKTEGPKSCLVFAHQGDLSPELISAFEKVDFK